jgi:hypothetical protein
MHSSAAQREVNVTNVWKKPENKNRYRKIRKGKSQATFLHGNIPAVASRAASSRQDVSRKNHAGQKRGEPKPASVLKRIS